MKPNKPAKDTFTVTEVGTLLESLEKKIDHIGELVVPLPSRLSAVEERLSAVEVRLTGVEDAVRIAVPDLSRRVSGIESKVGI